MPAETQTDCSRSVGLIGIGLLGQAIAERLLASGFDVYGFDTRTDLDDFTAVGGRVCSCANQVAENAKRIILCLPDSEIGKQVVAELSPRLIGHTLIDTTTGAPADAIAMSRQLATNSVVFLDVTVAGSSRQMREHQATLLVGCASPDYQACQDLLQPLGAKVFHVGDVGSASRMKLVVNLAIGLNRAVLAEALAFGESLGFPSQQVADVLRNTPAHSAAMDAKAEKMVREDFQRQARLRQHLKDVKLILQLADEHQARVPLSKLHESLLEGLVEAGYGDLDNSAVVKAFRN